MDSVKNKVGVLVDLVDGGISRDEARDLLEATNGSVERAVELHFSRSADPKPAKTQEKSIKHPPSTPSPNGKTKRNVKAARQSTTPPSNKKQKQLTLDFAFSPSSKKSPPVACKGKNQSNPAPAETKGATDPKKSTTPISESSLETTSRLESVPAAATARESLQTQESKVPPASSSHSQQQANSSGTGQLLDIPYQLLDIPYSDVVQQLATVAGTTKRTLKLQALQSLFQDVVKQLGHATTNNNDNNNSIKAQAHVLHMTLDLILGKLTTVTVANPSSLETNPSITLQVSGGAVSKALQVVLGMSQTQMRQSYRKLGDLGDVAAEALSKKTSVKSFFVVANNNNNNSKPTKTLFTVKKVHESLQALATVQVGKGSASARHEILVKLFRAAQQDQDTMRILVRTVLGNMRLGATLKTVLAALAMAVANVDPSLGDQERRQGVQLADRLQKVYNVCPRLNEICAALLQGGIEHAEATCTLALGYPVEPMLANPAHSLDQVEQFLRKSNGSAAVAEWKYDGVRCQAHYSRAEGEGTDGKGTVKLFSRHLLDQSQLYPDAASYFLEAAFKKNPNIDSFICDAEIVAVLPSPSSSEAADTKEETEETNLPTFRLLPFQDLRRGTSKSASSQGQVRVYCFDLLYLDGESLLKTSLWKRHMILRQSFCETRGFAFAQSVAMPPLTPNVDFDQQLLTNALTSAIEGGAEGLMVKLTGEYNRDNNKESVEPCGWYESGLRSHEWLKVKRDYVGGSFADTIDVVPIGAWHGNGRKARAGYLSPVLFAVYDEDDGVFRSISRCMSFSDKMYEAMRDFYLYGTPYPDAELEETNGKEVEKDDDGDDANSVGSEGNGNEEDDAGSGTAEEFDGSSAAESENANCFPGRPPSSCIVTNENPPIWFKPLEVFEVSFADLSISRVHTAAAGLIDDNEGRGIALRFPRFKRRRPDKTPEQATTTTQIARLFYQQSKTVQRS